MHSAGWVKTEYYSQNSPSTFFTIGTLEGLNGGSALPVQLVYFTAEGLQDNTVLLTWETSFELNNDYFELQRSLDGYNFKSIGRVSGAGNSNRPLSYNFVDESPYGGYNYYRVKQVDFNGLLSYFPVRGVEIDEDANSAVFSAAPNPFQDQISINALFVKNENCTVEMYDLMGRIVYSTTIKTVELQQHYKISDLNRLNAGTYLVVVKSGGNKSSFVMVKKD